MVSLLSLETPFLLSLKMPGNLLERKAYHLYELTQTESSIESYLTPNHFKKRTCKRLCWKHTCAAHACPPQFSPTWIYKCPFQKSRRKALRRPRKLCKNHQSCPDQKCPESSRGPHSLRLTKLSTGPLLPWRWFPPRPADDRLSLTGSGLDLKARRQSLGCSSRSRRRDTRPGGGPVGQTSAVEEVKHGTSATIISCCKR